MVTAQKTPDVLLPRENSQVEFQETGQVQTLASEPDPYSDIATFTQPIISIKQEQPSGKATSLGLGDLTSYEEASKAPREDSVKWPKLEWPDKASPAVTSTVRRLLEIQYAITVTRALQDRFPINRTKVTTFKNPESGVEKVILNLGTNATGIQAISFWDSLEKDFQDWLTKLPSHMRIILRRDASLHIHWASTKPEENV